MIAAKRPPGVEPRYASPAEASQLVDPILKLTRKQIKFIELMGEGKDQNTAKEIVGFKSRSAVYKCLTNPLAIQYLSAIRSEARAIAAYNAASAMADATDAAQFARDNKNPMALVRAYELKSKLAGLLIDRVEVVTVDLRGALSKAEQRVLNITPASTQIPQAPTQAGPDKPAECHVCNDI